MGRWIELARLISYRKEYAFLYSRFLRPTNSVPTGGSGNGSGVSGGGGSGGGSGGNHHKGSHFVFHIDMPSSITTSSSSPSTTTTSSSSSFLPLQSPSSSSHSSSYETTLALALARLLHLETILPIHIIVTFRVYARLVVSPIQHNLMTPSTRMLTS